MALSDTLRVSLDSLSVQLIKRKMEKREREKKDKLNEWIQFRVRQKKHLQFFNCGTNASALLSFDRDGSVADIPNILPGGNASIDFPVSFDTNRNAIASSTACWRFNAT